MCLQDVRACLSQRAHADVCICSTYMHTSVLVCVCVCEEADDPVGSGEANGRALLFPLAGKPASTIITGTAGV